MYYIIHNISEYYDFFCCCLFDVLVSRQCFFMQLPLLSWNLVYRPGWTRTHTERIGPPNIHRSKYVLISYTHRVGCKALRLGLFQLTYYHLYLESPHLKSQLISTFEMLL